MCKIVCIFHGIPAVLPGHIDLQEVRRIDSPWQSSPPPIGVGLVQVLSRCCQPLPQDTEHAVHLDHDDHPPFTVKLGKEIPRGYRAVVHEENWANYPFKRKLYYEPVQEIL